MYYFLGGCQIAKGVLKCVGRILSSPREVHVKSMFHVRFHTIREVRVWAHLANFPNLDVTATFSQSAFNCLGDSTSRIIVLRSLPLRPG